MVNNIYIADTPKENEFLREKTAPFDFTAHSKKEIAELVRKMRKIMKAANGIGLAANQIGLPWRLFVAEIEGQDGTPKFYAVFNPVIEKMSPEKRLMEEGCLSVPGAYGEVNRSVRVTLSGQDKNGRKIRINAWGALAHVFQHETDHLGGVLFIDKSKNVVRGEDPASPELAERHKRRQEKR